MQCSHNRHLNQWRRETWNQDVLIYCHIAIWFFFLFFKKIPILTLNGGIQQSTISRLPEIIMALIPAIIMTIAVTASTRLPIKDYYYSFIIWVTGQEWLLLLFCCCNICQPNLVIETFFPHQSSHVELLFRKAKKLGGEKYFQKVSGEGGPITAEL